MPNFDSLWEKLQELDDYEQSRVLARLFGYLEANDKKEELEVISRSVKEITERKVAKSL